MNLNNINDICLSCGEKMPFIEASRNDLLFIECLKCGSHHKPDGNSLLLIARPSLHEEWFNLPNGRLMYIQGTELDICQRLSKLPMMTKLQILDISVDSLSEYLTETKAQTLSDLTGFFKKKWLDNECAEPYNFSDPERNEYDFGHSLTYRQIISRFKKGELSIMTVKQIMQDISKLYYCSQDRESDNAD